MSLFSKLFGGGGAAETEAILHEGFSIYPEPIAESGGHRICARIEKEIDGELQSHQMIRADVYSSRDAAIDASVNKAKSMIDLEKGNIFGRP